MKIAFISEHASPLASIGSIDSGGQNIYVTELSKNLASLGYDVDIFTRKDNNKLLRVVNLCNKVRVIHVKAGPEKFIEKEQLLPHMQEFAEDMFSFLKGEGLEYKLVHANFFMSALVASKIKSWTGIPYTVTFHALGLVRKAYQKEADRFPLERTAIERMIVKDADTLIAECPEDKNDLIKYYNADPLKISVIPCGFSATEFSPVNKKAARKILGLKNDEKIILQLGRMVPRKGIDNVIQALARLGKYSNVKLLIVGGDYKGECINPTPEMQRLIDLAKEEGVEDQIIFTGRKGRNELKYYYSAADIFITTPWYEPFGITPLEAMACGVPVIGSNVGGIKYSVKDGVTGFLVPAKDPSALCEKIRYLLDNNSLLEQMRINSIKRVNEQFTWEKVAVSVHLLYSTMLKKAVNKYAYKPSYSNLSVALNNFKNLIVEPLLSANKQLSNE